MELANHRVVWLLAGDLRQELCVEVIQAVFRNNRCIGPGSWLGFAFVVEVLNGEGYVAVNVGNSRNATAIGSAGCSLNSLTVALDLGGRNRVLLVAAKNYGLACKRHVFGVDNVVNQLEG